ncbi:Rieske 2Fe-2S domain-containing protein [Thermobifida halotolerans]|uniref:Cytochrome bc1 complex Rieske iron-sulfur subunit n=2 Tax=Thermobifida halotolerans TaxID=483545 RepID=A0AA97M1W0_9ACTN|nr:Rieske 2Fe-2S domain-containing protein [Thermobifida halotolerans]
MTDLSRRVALAAVGGTAVAGALAGCGDDDGGAQPAPDGAASGPADGEGGGEVLARVDEIPVGGGTVFADRSVVVTRPEAGTIVAFSARCTHQGCDVDEVSGGTINCPCHGSRFAVADGSVVSGPATEALPEVPVDVRGDTVSLR